MGFKESKLWEKFNNATKETAFINEVEKFCQEGEDISKLIIKFFPTFTWHDSTHIENVCNWMFDLLGDKITSLSAENIALLLMAACWHDSGMSVNDSEKEKLNSELEANKTNPSDSKWCNYFKKHPGDEVAYNQDTSVADRILRTYVREHHHERAEKKIKEYNWSSEFTKHHITSKLLSEL
jgi:hypothetical protein